MSTERTQQKTQQKTQNFGRELFAWSADGHAVSVNLRGPNSHAATHIEKHKHWGFWHLAQLAVARTVITKPNQAAQIDMGRPIGQMDLVPVQSEADIFYFRRPNRGATWYPGVSCALNDRPETNSIVVITQQIERAQVLADDPHPNLFGPVVDAAPQANLFTVYPGVKTPGVPDGNPEFVTEQSHAFWRQYALAVDPNESVIIYDGPGVPESYRQQ
jgi:hypothetical protein